MSRYLSSAMFAALFILLGTSVLGQSTTDQPPARLVPLMVPNHVSGMSVPCGLAEQPISIRPIVHEGESFYLVDVRARGLGSIEVLAEGGYARTAAVTDAQYRVYSFRVPIVEGVQIMWVNVTATAAECPPGQEPYPLVVDGFDVYVGSGGR